jgi:hypothetical protein
LISDWGIIEESIDNKYVTCKEDLFAIGVMRFQQWFMENDAWEFDIVPKHDVKLGDYVQLTVPPKAGCPERLVNGIISGVKADYNASSSEFTMTLTVLSTDSLCSTTYVSGNLIKNFCGSNGDGEWTSSGTTETFSGEVNNDSLVLFTLGTFGVAYTHLEQPCMTIGDQYTISFYAEFLDGAPSGLTFGVFDGATPVGSALPVTATNNYTLTFTATNDMLSLRWILITSGFSNFWKISNIVLTKVITA